MKIIVVIFLALFSGFVLAVGEREASGTVKLHATSGKIFIELSGSNPTCGNRYYFSPDTDYNKALLSMLLAAQMSGKRVWVNGSGVCESAYPYGNAYLLVNMALYN